MSGGNGTKILACPREGPHRGRDLRENRLLLRPGRDPGPGDRDRPRRQPGEWDTPSSPPPEMRRLVRRHIDLPGLRWHRTEPGPSGDPGLAPFRSCHDLFGVGNLVILPAHDPVAVSRLAQATGQVPTLTAA